MIDMPEEGLGVLLDFLDQVLPYRTRYAELRELQESQARWEVEEREQALADWMAVQAAEAAMARWDQDEDGQC